MPKNTPSRSLSIVLPAYNEEGRLGTTVTRLQDWIEKDHDRIRDVELIIVEDGCTDATPYIANRLAGTYDNVTALHFDDRLGKGQAIERGFDAGAGEILCFMDVDRATEIDCLDALFEPLYEGAADITIGTRYAETSQTSRGRLRDLMSRSYNWLTRSLLRTGLTDHQCGFKAMHNDVFYAINDDITANGWFWDTELLMRGIQHGFRIQEVPIHWTESTDSSVTLPTVVTELGGGLLRLKGEQWLGKRYGHVAQYGRFAVIGGIGAILNTVILYILTEFAGMYYLFSAVIAIESSILTMFFLNNHFTFTRTKAGMHPIIRGIIRSNMVRSIGIIIQIGLLYVLTELGGVYYVISNIVAIFIASLFNFVGEKRFNWQE